MQLSQPSVLALFTMSSALAIGGCYLLIPWSDWACTFRQPVILTALSLSGSVLAGRVWRISTIMSPVLKLGGDSSFGFMNFEASDSETSLGDEAGEEKVGRRRRKRRKQIRNLIIQMKSRTMDVLSVISNWKRLLRCLRLRRKRRRRLSVSISIRQKVPVDRLLFLVFVIMLPQLFLQILNIAVPVMRETRNIHYDNDIMVAYHTCNRSSGPASFVVGILLALFPYFLTFLLSFDDTSGSLPEVFDEINAFVRACHIFFIVTLGTAPAAILARTPDAELYATTFLVVGGAVIPPVLFIVINKLKPIWRGEKAMVVTHLLQRLGTGGIRSKNRRQHRRSTSIVDSVDDADEASQPVTHASNSVHDRDKRRQQAEAFEKSANLALTIAKMYEDIGQSKKTVQIYDDALNLWKTDHNRQESLIGDYTEDEVNAMERKEVTLICSLLIAKGRVLGSLAPEDSRAASKAANAWLDSLDIFDHALAASNIKDRSIIFPCFSGIMFFLKGNKIQKPASYETDLVRRFVVEAKEHYEIAEDPVHYARALAMQSEILANDSRFDEALEAFATMKTIYDVDEHSDLVSKHYGTDFCAQAYAYSALWYIEVGKKELGMRTHEHVIGEILNKMDPSNVLNFNVILLPIIKILKSKGEAKRARELYNTYVIANYEKHFKDGQKMSAKPLMKPMMLLLKICGERGPYRGMDADIEYMAEGDNGTVPPMLDNIYSALCWSMSSLSAEICLLLAERLAERSAVSSVGLGQGLGLGGGGLGTGRSTSTGCTRSLPAFGKGAETAAAASKPSASSPRIQALAFANNRTGVEQRQQQSARASDLFKVDDDRPLDRRASTTSTASGNSLQMLGPPASVKAASPMESSNSSLLSLRWGNSSSSMAMTGIGQQNSTFSTLSTNTPAVPATIAHGRRPPRKPTAAYTYFFRENCKELAQNEGYDEYAAAGWKSRTTGDSASVSVASDGIKGSPTSGEAIDTPTTTSVEDMGKIAAQQWRTMSSLEKFKYEEMANRDAKRYQEEAEEFYKEHKGSTRTVAASTMTGQAGAGGDRVGSNASAQAFVLPRAVTTDSTDRVNTKSRSGVTTSIASASASNSRKTTLQQMLAAKRSINTLSQVEKNADLKRQGDLPLIKKLIQKGTLLARKADAILKDEEGAIKFKLAYETHEPLLFRLEALVNDYNIDLAADLARGGNISLSTRRGPSSKSKFKRPSLDMLWSSNEG